MEAEELNGNAKWLKERAVGIRNNDRPKDEEEWLAFATGLEMIATDWERTQDMILGVITPRKVTNLNDVKFQRGEPMFLTCKICNQKPGEATAGYSPLIVHGGDAPVIAGLICLGCEHELHVVNGKVS